MIRQLKLLGGLLLAGALVACGGGGGSPGQTSGSSGGGTTTGPVPATVDVFTSSPVLSAGTSSSLSFTVVVKDANNQAIPNQTVTFAASSGNLVGALPPPATGPAGEAITTVSLTPGADRSNRDIVVTVRAGGATREVVIPVTGTQLALSGDSSLLLGNSATFTVRAQDAGGVPIPNATITVQSALGNTISPTSVVTSASGAATFVYRGNNSGLDTITATGVGTAVTSNISVSSDVFQFVTPAAGHVVAVGATQTATVSLRRGGAPVVGQAVTFSTTRGVVFPTAVVTDANGNASTEYSSSSSGPANLVAQVPNAQVTVSVSFLATNPASIIVQANPGALPPNAAGTSGNQSTILATVRDPAGNPVAGQVVNFTLVTDGSNGRITPGSATTDSSGNAQTQFVPGGLTTSNNGVVIQASVPSTTLVGTTSVTVNAQALFISIASSNVIGQLNPQTYEKEFSVYVTDANGAPAGNRVVTLEVFPIEYYKGTYSRGPDDDQWRRNEAAACQNEDLNRNGILDRSPVDEDVNGNGRLEPGLPIVVTPASVTTNASGFATFKLQYGENYSTWMNTLITARTTVGGTESVQRQEYFLFALLEDLQNEATPANVRSPFGTAASCTDPN
jgi:hypothetical protein